jgi:uroporphyrinogen-III synthase
MSRPLLIIRPSPASSHTAKMARKRGIEAICVPMFSFAPIPYTLRTIDQIEAIIFTSANGVKYSLSSFDKIGHLPAHCVGEATAREAARFGYTLGVVGTGGVEALLSELPPLSLLHFAGTVHVEPTSDKHRIETVISYEMRAIEPPPPFFDTLKYCPVIALHSPVAAARIAELITNRSRIALAVFSENVAEAAGTGWQRVEVADLPRDDALMSAVQKILSPIRTEAP